MIYEDGNGNEVHADEHYSKILDERIKNSPDEFSLAEATSGLPVRKSHNGTEYVASGPPRSFKKAAKTVGVSKGLTSDDKAMSDMLSNRLKASEGASEAFRAKCEKLDKDVRALPSSAEHFEKWFDKSSLKAELVANMIKTLKGPYKRTTYEPKTIKARFLYFVEGLFIGIANWFFYRDVSAIITTTYPAPPPTAEEKLAGDIISHMVLTSGADNFLKSGWDMVEATKPENVKTLPGESKADAIRRIVSECMSSYDDEKDTSEEQFYCPAQVTETVVQNVETGELITLTREAEEPPAKTSDSYDPNNNGALNGRHSQVHDKHIPLDQVRFVVSKEEERFASDTPANDPILKLAKQARLKELLNKLELTEAESKAVKELTFELGSDGVIILYEPLGL